MTTGQGENPLEKLVADASPAMRAWVTTLACLGALFLLVIVAHWEAVSTAVYLWANRPTYNHGFLIIPIALYLVWDRRSLLAREMPAPWMLGVPGLFAVSGVWFFAHAAGLMEGEHFVVVAMFQAVLVTLLGWRLYWALLLPANYLWLMVPTGTLFFPVLQKIAAVLSAWMLQLSGVPLFHDGLLLSVPTGDYFIAEGCAGLNFILSTLALAPLYATFVYASLRKRIIAVLVALAVSIIANAVRIYVIIILAEATDRRIDIVDDHLLYGWGFFVVILAVMGWIGLRFADPEEPKPEMPTEELPKHPHRKLMLVSALAALVLLILPLYAAIFGAPQIDLGLTPPHIEKPAGLMESH